MEKVPPEMEPHCGVESLGAGGGGLKCYLEHRMYRRKAPHGGHSDDLSHQVSPQEMRVQLMKLEVRAPDPAFGQEPGHRGIRGQEKRWWWGTPCVAVGAGAGTRVGGREG